MSWSRWAAETSAPTTPVSGTSTGTCRTRRGSRWTRYASSGTRSSVALRASRRSWTRKPRSAARAGVPLITMDAIAVGFAGILVALRILAMLAAWHPGRGRRQVAEPRRGPDYEAMADVESRDIDDMLDAV